MNLQCYAGGGGNSPTDWAQAVQSAPDTGVTDAYAFIVPGYAVLGADGAEPASLEQTFAGLAGTGITGGFLWNSGGIWSTEASEGSGAPLPSDYAQAITNGLGLSAAAKALGRDLVAAVQRVGQGRAALHELQRHRIDAVAQPGRRRAVGEEVALVAVAAGAAGLDAHHAVGASCTAVTCASSIGRVEAGPAGAALELGLVRNSGRPQRRQQ
jgi:hypothetical protein